MEFAYPFEIPNLSSNLSTEEALRSLIPHGYSDIVNVEEGKECLVLKFPYAEEHVSEVQIPKKLYNPVGYNTNFPDFCLQISEFMPHRIDYFDGFEHFILNQNQMIWLILQHRFTMYRENTVHYTSLTTNDLSELANYSETNIYSSDNAIKKGHNTVCIINCWGKDFNNPEDLVWKRKENGKGEWVPTPIGDSLKPPSLTRKQLVALFRDLPLQAGSESMASESAKFVVSDHRKAFYSAVGYGTVLRSCSGLEKQREFEYKKLADKGMYPERPIDGKYLCIKTIFKPKSNLPARIKSHIMADAYRFARPSAPIFGEDICDRENMATDGTMIDAVVIFDHMDPITGRLVCGEIEASNKIASTLVHKDETIRGVFKELNVEVGQTYTKDQVLIGTDIDDREYILRGNKSVEIVSIDENVVSDSYTIVAKCIRQVGSGRIFSHTGLKGVTKPKPDLGKVYVDLPDGSKKQFNVDLVTGMNAVKGKKNTILLAQAALMFRAGQCGDKQYLKSLDANQINDICSKVDKVTWIDQYGIEKKAYAGIIQISVNELSYMFNNVKAQKFMPESGRYLHHGGQKELADEIWKNGVDTDEKEAVLELHKILNDDLGLTGKEDGLPFFSPNELKDQEIFDVTDLKYERKPIYPHVTKILNEDYNQGFCIDLRYRGGGVVRIPSAKTLNLFKKNLASGDWIYPQLLVNVSKVIQCCIEEKADGRTNVGWLSGKKGSTGGGQIGYYLTQVRKVLHKPVNLATSLLKPRIKGVGMKQMTDMYVPQGTVVIMDDRAYKSLKRESEADKETDDLGLLVDEKGNLVLNDAEKTEDLFKALCIRNPVVWKLQVQSLTIWNKEQFRKHLATHGVDLDKYLITKFCREILFMNPEDAIYQQSDVDGDLMPVYVPYGQVAQEHLRTFGSVDGHKVTGVAGIVKDELSWTQKYRDGEIEADEDLNIDGGYEIYTIPVNYSPFNGDTYCKFFANSIIAKGDVGLATHHNWTVQSLVELFKRACSLGLVTDTRRLDSTDLITISEEEANTILYTYSRLVQDYVIRGIKHNSKGSSGFEQFLLTNINDPKYNPDVKGTLKDVINIDKAIIEKMFIMIAWGTHNGMTESIMQFISIHNKGSKPDKPINKEHFAEIVDHTYYGGLVKPLYEISNRIDEERKNRDHVAINDPYYGNDDRKMYA